MLVAQKYAGVGIVAVASALFWIYQYSGSNLVPYATKQAPIEEDPWAVWRYLNGPPTKHFKDNLRNDTKYITAFGDAGWTNDVMTFWNLVYLAMLTERVPIIPPHTPETTHVGKDAGNLEFGHIFDVPRFRRELGMPILEWADVKTDDTWNEIGCWSSWATADRNGNPRNSRMMQTVKLDASFTPVPLESNLWMKKNRSHSTYWGLAELGWPEERERGIQGKTPTLNRAQHAIYPDDQVLCFDFIYWLVNNREIEWEKEYHPAWRFVGKHLHFNSDIVALAEGRLRELWHLTDEQPIPPFISMHVRHGDFEHRCKVTKIATEDCFAPISAFARRVEEVRAELKRVKNIDARYVVVTSDEESNKWWKQIKQKEKDGWYFLNYASTIETYGSWYPTIIDGVIQSMGTGFVGTEGSTMSLVALRRVRDWNSGVVKMVKWGNKGADDK